MAGESGIPFPFTTYGTKTGGLKVGQEVTDESTGYVYVFCQADTTCTNDTFAAGEFAVQVSATQRGICSNRATGSLDATYVMALGVVTSACPESTATVTYYFWALKRGYTATIKNDGTDVVIGYHLHLVAADPVTCKAVVGTTTSNDWTIISTFGRASVTTTGTTTSGFVNFRDI